MRPQGQPPGCRREPLNSGKSMSIRPLFHSIVAVSALVVALPAVAQRFHNAPASSATLKNPDTGKKNAAAGQNLYEQHCASCHGANAQGSGNVPSLARGATQAAKPGEIFWFITHGDAASGMPAWESLPAQQRWQLVTYLKYLHSAGAAQLTAASTGTNQSTAKLNAPPPKPPVSGFSLREAGNDSQNHSAGSSRALCDQIRRQRPDDCSPLRRRLAAGSQGLQSVVVCHWTRQPPPDPDRSQRRLLRCGNCERQCHYLSRNHCGWKTEDNQRLRKRAKRAVWDSVLPSWTGPEVAVHRKYQCGGAVSLQERRSDCVRTGAAHRESTRQRQRPYHARHSLLSRWQNNVRLCRVGIER